MEKNKLNKVIEAFRNLRELKEQAMGVGGGVPTNALAHGQIAGTKEAGDQPPVDLRRGKRRNWNPFFKDLARVQRRKLPKV